MSELKTETVKEFLARGGKITKLPSTRVRGFDKHSIGKPSILSRDWDYKTGEKPRLIDEMYKCGFFKS